MASGAGDEGGIFWGDSTEQAEGGQSSATVNRVKYREFIRTFRLDDVYVYRDALRSAIVTRQAVMEVDIDHLMEFDEELTNELLVKPSVHLPVFEQAALEAAVSVSIMEEGDEDVRLQITLISSKQPISIRKLLSNQAGPAPPRHASPRHADPTVRHLHATAPGLPPPADAASSRRRCRIW